MQFQDYYKTLEVQRTATPEEIKKSYRRLSKQYHPDTNQQLDAKKKKEAEAKFKQIGEAYEVLKDPEKRKRYDQLGQHWNTPGAGAGAGAGAAPNWGGWQNVEWSQGGPGAGRGRSGAPTGFSDFFDTFFAQSGGFGGVGGDDDPFASRRRGQQRRNPYAPREGEDREAELTLPLEDVVLGIQKQVTLSHAVTTPDGGRRVEEKSYSVKVPAGTADGTRIRLKGEGQKGENGGKDGDLYLKVKLAPHPRFVVDGADLHARLPVAPWEAAFGAKVPFSTLEGEVKLTVPKGATSGSKLRLKGKGLPQKDGERGALVVEVVVAVPAELSADEARLLEQWQALRPNFPPR